MPPFRFLVRLLAISVAVMPFSAGATEALLQLSPEFAPSVHGDLPRGKIAPWHVRETQYLEFDALKWQMWVGADAEMTLDDLQSADFTVAFPGDSKIMLHWNKGSHSKTTDFQPLESPLPVSLASFGGRSSDGAMPYFNLAAEGGGVIVAVGWTGDWQAQIDPAGPGRARIRAGLRHEKMTLPAGEKLRMPSILAMSYRGNWLDGQNKFRRLMLAHFTPTNHAPLALMPVAASVHGMIGFNDTTEANLTALATDIAALNLPLDTYWLDAGWNEGGFPRGQGNPAPDAVRFPNGLAPVGAAVASAGLRFLTWFEPERAMRDTWLEREHPTWLLSPTLTPPKLRYQENDGFRLVDLGNAEARAWAVENVSEIIANAHIGIYRQDFNLYPAYFWQAPTPEETALREVRYINGLYDYLDALCMRFPDLILDNCASGGRRLDFEMMRRSVALWRSDSCWDSKDFPRNVQAMAHGLSLWVPLHGLGAAASDTLALRSGMGACASFAINYRDPAAVAALREHLARYLPVRGLFTKDFYPLTPWSTDGSAWLAWQFHDPKTNRGIVQAFCSDTAGREEIRIPLQALTPGATYTLTDWDKEESNAVAGTALLGDGILIQATRKSEAIVIEYAVAIPNP